MSFFTNWLNLANLALEELGEPPITQAQFVAAAIPAAKHTRLHYREAVRLELKAVHWNCAIKRETLTQPTACEFDYAYQFCLPKCYIDFVSVWPSGSRHAIENGHLLSDHAVVGLRYVWDVDNPQVFDPDCGRAIALRLAEMAAYGITEDAAQSEAMLRKYELHLKKAKMSNKMESPYSDRRNAYTGWVDSRRRGVRRV